MISFWRIFWLESVSLIRSRTLAMLVGASVAWVVAVPHVIRGDGTAAGDLEICIRYSLGGVFALLIIALLASATGSLARERAARRLQLTMVRPVRYLSIVTGKVLAHAVVGAAVLALAGGALLLHTGAGATCHHVFRPVLPTPREEALDMYEAYIRDPDTPEAVRRARKSVVLRILTQRAADHYQTIPTNETVRWTFALPSAALDGASAPSVRLRFSAQYDMRQDVRGRFAIGGWSAAVSNMTQSVITVPLKADRSAGDRAALTFRNDGKFALMLRPRKDIEVLTEGDAFWRNLVRAWIEMTAVLTLIVAFGTFLSAALGRPVALFVAVVTLAVGEMSPSVIEQYPDELGAGLVDRAGLAMTRVVAELTHPLSALSPLSALASGDCIETREAIRVTAFDLFLLPLLLSVCAALVLPLKQDEL